MFRKNEEAAALWSMEKVISCSRIQKELIDYAVRMLRPGGMLMYSTCTFAPEEDEEVVRYALDGHPELELLPIEPYEGFAPGRPEWADTRNCVRIWPHRMQGEGHFLALLRRSAAESGVHDGERVRWKARKGDGAGRTGSGNDERKNRRTIRARERQKKAACDDLFAWMQEMQITLPAGEVERRGDRFFLMPELPAAVKNLRFLRSGLHLGEQKKDRFEPAQPLALALSQKTCGRCVSIPAYDPVAAAWLRGESVPLDSTQNTGDLRRGWVLVCVGAHPVGWGKITGRTLKNRIPSGWRNTL